MQPEDLRTNADGATRHQPEALVRCPTCRNVVGTGRVMSGARCPTCGEVLTQTHVTDIERKPIDT